MGVEGGGRRWFVHMAGSIRLDCVLRVISSRKNLHFQVGASAQDRVVSAGAVLPSDRISLLHVYDSELRYGEQKEIKERLDSKPRPFL